MRTMAESMHNAAEVMDMMAAAVEAGKRVPHFSIILRDYARLMEGGARKIEQLVGAAPTGGEG